MKKSITIAAINMIVKKNKTMIYRIGMLSFLFLVQSVTIGFAQRTQVNVDSEINLNLKSVLETKITKLLMDINVFQTEGKDNFSNDSGIEEIKKLVNDNELYSVFDSIRVSLMMEEDSFIATQIYLQKINGNPYQFTELSLNLNKKTMEITGVSVVDSEYSFERILTDEIDVSVAEQDSAKAFLAKFLKTIHEKNGTQLKSFFSENALVVSDSINPTANKSAILMKRTALDFVNEVRSELFIEDNDVALNYSEAILFRHPEFNNLVGFTAKASWISSAYSFENYVWITIDLSKDTNQIVTYIRKSSPFLTTSLKSIIQKPLLMKAGVIALSSDTSIYYPRHGILLKTQSSYPDLLTTAKIAEMLQQDRIRFSDIHLVKDSIRIIQDAVYIQYTIPQESLPAFKIEQTMEIDQSLGLGGLSQKIDVYAGKDTEILLAAESIAEALPVFTELSDLETITFKSKPEQVEIVVADKNNFPIAKVSPSKTGEAVNLTDGNYSLFAYKDGFYTKKSSFEVKKGQDRMVVVRLNPVGSLIKDEVDSPLNKPKIKRKWKVLGIAAILAGSAYIYMMSNDTSRPKIPNPPGRPIGL